MLKIKRPVFSKSTTETLRKIHDGIGGLLEGALAVIGTLILSSICVINLARALDELFAGPVDLTDGTIWKHLAVLGGCAVLFGYALWLAVKRFLSTVQVGFSGVSVGRVVLHWGFVAGLAVAPFVLSAALAVSLFEIRAALALLALAAFIVVGDHLLLQRRAAQKTALQEKELGRC